VVSADGAWWWSGTQWLPVMALPGERLPRIRRRLRGLEWVAAGLLAGGWAIFINWMAVNNGKVLSPGLAEAGSPLVALSLAATAFGLGVSAHIRRRTAFGPGLVFSTAALSCVIFSYMVLAVVTNFAPA
jgi:hypothetical protein